MFRLNKNPKTKKKKKDQNDFIRLLCMLNYVLKTHNTCKQRVGGSMLTLGIIQYYNSSTG